jgi:hypothetical protein
VRAGPEAAGRAAAGVTDARLTLSTAALRARAPDLSLAQTYSIGFTELMESKLSLVEKAKLALDDTVAAYKMFLDDVPPSLL